MSIDERAKDSTDAELQNLVERPVTDADQVRGGARTQPSGPVPIPYPTIKSPGAIRSLEPCL